MATSADGIIRRWVDVVWTSSRRLRARSQAHPHGLFQRAARLHDDRTGLLSVGKPLGLLKIATHIMNFALGFSCFHTLVINLTLLPKPLRPGWFARWDSRLAACFSRRWP